jgi:hypothetical protein
MLLKIIFIGVCVRSNMFVSFIPEANYLPMSHTSQASSQ